MVDVGTKAETRRRAVAACRIGMSAQALEALRTSTAPKGDVFAVAQIAGVQAAKRTPELIPGCHPLRIEAVEVSFAIDDDGVDVEAEVRGTDRTGFEMEALCACSVAALTVYDMLKGIDAAMEISSLRLVSKEGGKSSLTTSLEGVRAAVLVVSDRSAAGEREDRSGPAAREWLQARGAEVAEVAVVADDREAIASELRRLGGGADLVVTSGGTGVGPRDITPEATLDVADRVVPGLAEAIRERSLRVTPHAMLSRGTAAVVSSALVVNLPGSPKAVVESLDAVAAALPHAIVLLRGEHPH
jgi:molybdenum cofactor biosynthesis protein MoaC